MEKFEQQKSQKSSSPDTGRERNISTEADIGMFIENKIGEAMEAASTELIAARKKLKAGTDIDAAQQEIAKLTAELEEIHTILDLKI